MALSLGKALDALFPRKFRSSFLHAFLLIRILAVVDKFDIICHYPVSFLCNNMPCILDFAHKHFRNPVNLTFQSKQLRHLAKSLKFECDISN